MLYSTRTALPALPLSGSFPAFDENGSNGGQQHHRPGHCTDDNVGWVCGLRIKSSPPLTTQSTDSVLD